MKLRRLTLASTVTQYLAIGSAMFAVFYPYLGIASAFLGAISYWTNSSRERIIDEAARHNSDSLRAANMLLSQQAAILRDRNTALRMSLQEVQVAQKADDALRRRLVRNFITS